MNIVRVGVALFLFVLLSNAAVASTATSSAFVVDTRHVAGSGPAVSTAFKIDTRGAGVAFTEFDNSDSFPIDTRGASSGGGVILGLVIEGSNDFGAVTVGASALRVLTLRNQTASPMTIGAATNLPFTMEGASAANLAANGIGVLGVRFVPTQSGIASGALHLAGGPNPIIIPLSGRGVGTGPTSAPTLGSVTPNPVTGSNASRTMTLTGTGFDPAMKVTWRNVTNNNQIYKDRVPTTVTPTQAVIGAVFGETAAQWSAQVVNPDGTESNVVSFNVTSPGAASQMTIHYEHPDNGRKLIGACMDGAAIIRVVVENVPIGVNAANVVITPPNETWIPKFGTQINLPEHRAWKDYKVPDDYPGGTAPWIERTFRVDAGESSAEEKCVLIRPPVLLVHGLWSGPGTFDTMRNHLMRSGFPLVKCVNYEQNAAYSFAVNRDVVGVAVTAAVNEIQGRGYACKKADVVGHSMGGILARYYIQDLGSLPFRYAGDVRSIITIGTPHAGSEWATVAHPLGVNLQNSPKLGDSLLSGILQEAMGNLAGGGVDDLRINSPAMTEQLNGPSVGKRWIPAHAIIGAIPGSGERGAIGVFWWVTRKIVPLVNVTSLLGTPNDLVVRGTSQQGGLEDRYSTEITVAAHIFETGNSEVIQKVATLLNEPMDGAPSSLMDPKGFDEAVQLGWSDALESALAAISLIGALPIQTRMTDLAPEEEIEITSPLDGAIVTPGEIVSVHVNAGSSVQEVMISATDATILNAPPFDFQFQVPMNETGSINISAMGSDASGTFLSSDVVTIHIETTATLQALNILPDDRITVVMGEAEPLVVLGDFNDGGTRDITTGADGTLYDVENDVIATVSVDGVVQGLQPGFTFLSAQNGNRADEIVVEVLSESPEPPSLDDSNIVSVNVPTQLATSHSFPARITMQNTGGSDWSAAEGYALAVESDVCGMITGTRIPISGGAVVQPGQTYSFDFPLDVPDSPGLCSFQLQMVRDVESESNFFGALVGVSTEVITAVNNATFESTTMAATMKPGQGLWFSISVRNTGTTLWFEGSNHSLGAVSDPNNILGGITRFPIPSGQTIQSNKVAQFLVYFKAPQEPGDYPVQLRMIEEFFEWFGDEINLNIHVEVPPNQVRGWETYE